MKPHFKKKTLLPKRKISFSLKRHSISAFDITIFFRQLATLISAGVPIVQSCEILRQSQENPNLKRLINSLKQDMEAGQHFTRGLQKYPRYFDDLICHLVHAGEQTGTIDVMLKRIATYKEKSLTFKNQIKQALFYPCMIFVVATAITIIMLTFVVPRFADLFLSMHGQLPAFTACVITLSTWIRHHLWLGLLPVLGIPIFIYFFKTSLKIRQHVDHGILKIPFLNIMLTKIILARFARSLATTYAAGVPITHALKIVANISGNHDFIKAITGLHYHVSGGKQLHLAMHMNPLFPTMPVQMVKIGEESGTLGQMLEKIAELYESDIDHIVANLSHLLEPLIMIILGVLIGGLVIAMYLPIFKLGTVI